uniref:RHS repeat-associated core domain-containing protein n=1 Tax=Chryseobacterium endophyticum TaxID=1854762 RepID=A0AAU6WMG0_9FLAO
MLQHYHKVDDNTEVLLTENTYNELSQLTNKKVGNNLQSIDYSYNIRGWLTWINRDQMAVPDLGGKLFSYKIKYNEREGITSPNAAQFPGKEVAAKYNGNIAEVDWRSVENIGNNPSVTPKRYGYVYDKLNRLTAGFYQTPNNPNVGENTESLEYDLNGNITKLFRTSVLEYGSTTPTKIDDLEYIYDAQNKSNKLITLNDNSFNPTGYEGGGMEIKYDVNGNMTEMPDKGINKIDYNYLNLPDKINYSKNGNESVIVNTKYSAGGEKLRKENTTTVFGINGYTTIKKNTDYLDGFQYLTTVTSTTPPPGGGGSESMMMMSNSETGRALERQAYSFDNDSSLTLTPVTLKTTSFSFSRRRKVFTIIKKISIFTSIKIT